MPDYLTPDEVKAEELSMLIEFDALCRREGLRYSLAGGTLLGAVRHKGFIPWDDDIDVSMPRPDFDKLVTLARFNKRSNDRIFEPYSNDWTHPIFLKYINRRVAVDAHYENGESNLWIDVTPVEGLSDDYDEVEHIYKRAKKLQRTIMFCKADPKEGKTTFKRVLKRLLVPMANSTGVLSRAVSELDSIGSSCAFGSTPWVGCTAWGLYGPGERYPYSGWENTVEFEFEGQRLKAISTWDAYLSGLYGNYMKLPPEDKRVTHEIKAWRIEHEE